MSYRVLKLHGIRVSDGGKGSLDLIDPYLRDAGLEPVDVDYGRFSLARVRLCNGCVASSIAALMRPGDVLLGHSNGCEIICEALKAGAKPAGVVLLNPALDADKGFPPGDYFVEVYHNPHDVAVLFAKYLPRHPWGSMGRVGYTGPADARVLNIDTSRAAQEYAVRGHSDIFTPAKLAYWGAYIAGSIASNIAVKEAA